MPVLPSKSLRLFVASLACVLVALTLGPVRSEISAHAREFAFKQLSPQGVDLAVTRDCEQAKIVPLPKAQKAGSADCEAANDSRRIPYCTAQTLARPPRAPALIKSAWVGIIVLRI